MKKWVWPRALQQLILHKNVCENRLDLKKAVGNGRGLKKEEPNSFEVFDFDFQSDPETTLFNN